MEEQLRSVVARARQIARTSQEAPDTDAAPGFASEIRRPWFGSFQIAVVAEKRREIQAQAGMDLVRYPAS